MPGGGSKPGERRGGRQRGTPNKTPTERAQALAAKVAKAEARANAKLVVEPLEHKLARDVLDWGMQYCVARASFCRPGLPGEPIIPTRTRPSFFNGSGLRPSSLRRLRPIKLQSCSRMRSKRRLQKTATLEQS